jgi:tripartite-type tricarboxylate transporter receptor subunit TctC
MFIKLMVTLATAITLAMPAHAEWPAKPITIVVPFNAGGGADAAARAFADKFQDAIGQPVFIQNKGGAGGIIGSNHVAKSTPDGYTMLLTTTVTFGGIQVSAAASNVTYDMYKDFDQVTIIGTTPRMLVASKTFAATSVADVIKIAKANPGTVSYAASVGSLDELNAVVFQQITGTKLNAIYYGTGASQAVLDVMSGHVNLMFDTLPNGLKTGDKGRIIAVSSESRLLSLPETPTFKELGFKDLSYTSYFGLAVPAKTPVDVIDKLNKALVKAIKDPVVANKLNAIGINPVGSTSAQATDTVINTAKLISKLADQSKQPKKQ